MALHVDDVVLTLAGESLAITQSYEVRAGIFMQPAGFAVRVGHGGVARKIIEKYPPGTLFSLAVGGNVVQTGFTDGFGAGEGSGATEVTLKGRDMMAPVVKAYVAAETAFSGVTYAELVEQVLALCGLQSYTRATGKLQVSNEANRKRITGKQIVQTAPPSVDKVNFELDGAEVTLFRNEVPGTTKSVYKPLKVTLGTKWYEGFLKIQLERGGLFLWAAGDGSIVLSAPNPAQEPAFRIFRPQRGERGPSNVIAGPWTVNHEGRYQNWVVYGRGGGLQFGRWKTRGEYVDPEITDGSTNTHHDNSCDTLRKCEHLARRRAAEANRDAWNLTYKVAGHSTDGRLGRGVWAPDTMVAVDDRELGIAGNFYLESLTMNCGPEKTTTLRLMRPEDLLFGEAQ